MLIVIFETAKMALKDLSFITKMPYFLAKGSLHTTVEANDSHVKYYRKVSVFFLMKPSFGKSFQGFVSRIRKNNLT